MEEIKPKTFKIKEEDFINQVPKKKKGKHILLALIALVLLLAGTSFYFYKRSSSDPAKMTQRESEKLIESIGEIALLPEGEVPTIATVSDPAALKNQSFFAEAIKGDKVLIYTNAKKAYLYRPSINKIITISPLSIGDAVQ